MGTILGSRCRSLATRRSRVWLCWCQYRPAGGWTSSAAGRGAGRDAAGGRRDHGDHRWVLRRTSRRRVRPAVPTAHGQAGSETPLAAGAWRSPDLGGGRCARDRARCTAQSWPTDGPDSPHSPSTCRPATCGVPEVRRSRW